MTTSPNEFAFSDFAAALAKAHAAGEPAVDFQEAGAVPSTVPEGMAVQAEVAQRLGASVAGWKVGAGPERIPDGAPLYTHLVRESGANFPVRKSGLWGVEPEIGVRLRSDLPPRPDKPYTREEIAEAVGAVFAGIEIVASRMIDFKAAPYPVFLADNIGNAGYIVGREVEDWRDLDLAQLHATLTIGGKTVHDAVGGHPYGDPLAPLLNYANAPCDSLGGLKVGQIVTTGSLCGLVAVSEPCEAVLVIEGLSETRVRLTK
ncbi:MAG: 2-keto-4-pentenoate hydratase [Alphaproteobacteria bacterium]